MASFANASDTLGNTTFYYGDIHLQTGASLDGGAADLRDCVQGDCGAVTSIIGTARDAGLDFMAVTDHANGPNGASPVHFDYVLQTVLAGHVDEEFVVIPGAELCCFTGDLATDVGHRNLYFFDDDIDFSALTHPDVLPALPDGSDVTDCAGIWSWLDALKGTWGDLLLIPHHPALQKASTDWGCFSEEYTSTVEVHSQHGNSMGDGDIHDPLNAVTSSGTVHAAIDPADHAHKLGFIASGDFHDSRPGQVCGTDGERANLFYGSGIAVAALDSDELFNRQSLYAAFTERRTYATSGPMMPVSLAVAIDGVSGTYGLGDVVELSPEQVVTVSITIPPVPALSVEQVWLVTPDGKRPTSNVGTIWRHTFAADAAPEWAYFRVEIDGSVFFGGDCADGGLTDAERIWMSPNWFSVSSEDTGGIDPTSP